MITVTAAIITRGDTVLLARRGIGMKLAGKWEFPGGKIDPGETPQECLAREIFEELGVEISVGAFVARSVFTYKHADIELLGYRCELVRGTIELREHSEIAWVRLEDLLSYELAPADIPLVESLLRGSE